MLIAQQPLPCELVVVTDPDLLHQRAEQLGLTIECQTVELAAQPKLSMPQKIAVLAERLPSPVQCGKPNPDHAHHVLNTIRRAVEYALSGKADAMVTGPVQKSSINDAGIRFSGHTEFIAKLTGGDPVMMLAVAELRVALATTHLPLAEVSGAITAQSLERVITTLHHDLISRFAIPQPVIGVCGLNPHAGEGGHFGREEIEIITPLLERLRTEGMALEGPLPADTIFSPDNLQRMDAVLAMYHDQGLPVLKQIGFGRAVNITLGLPIIRTSVDHGTALSLAGSRQVETGSLLAAIDSAVMMAVGSLQ